MYSVYALYSREYDKIYIGISSDVGMRLLSHNHPKNRSWTRNFRPWIIIFTEEMADKHEALIRERQLKSCKGREFIRSHVPG